jgi:hypothetical protein
MQQLVRSLLERTELGAIRWIVTDAPGTYAFVGHSGSVLLGGQGVFPVVRVLNEAGTVIDTYSSADADLNALFHIIERVVENRAKGNPVIDALLEELESA